MTSALASFHPLVARWFRERFGAPTEIQELAWPRIAAGEHVFITAPTGSGKTLTAFLHALDSLIRGASAARRADGHGSEIVYVSPLKALNNDIERNLATPLAELRHLFQVEGEAFPDIQVMVRSGDTPQSERRRLLRHPPTILITTPESLNLFLTTEAGRAVLADARTVILDEIHNTAGTKRGTYLMTAVERMAAEFGEFQRIALSATVRPAEQVARFVAGYRRPAGSAGDTLEPRPIRVLAARQAKEYELRVAFPSRATQVVDTEAWWAALVADFREIVAKNRSTIFFANSRRMAEKVSRLINEGLPGDIAYAHHGSLSREIRLAVEERLKSGSLPAIVATSSLELGIDIGDVDEVVLVQTPPEASSSIQRIGRAGHGVGQVSRGTFYPLYHRDFVDAYVALGLVLDREIEEVRIPKAPLDVLAQVLLAMCLERSRPADELFAIIRCSAPFHELERSHFDLVVNMLTGRYADRRIRELKPRLARDGAAGELRSLGAVRTLIYTSGGVIPDRGYFNLRTADAHEKIGELDEEFVWERSIGDVFPMGNRLWRIARISHNDVEVRPAEGSPVTVPFWRADEMNRGFFFSERVGLFMEEAARRLDQPDYAQALQTGGRVDEGAAISIISFLREQREQSGMALPHRHRVTVEMYRGARGQRGHQTVIHTFWGGRVNRPFSLVIASLLEKETGRRVSVFHNKDSVLVNSPGEFVLSDVLRDLQPERILPLLREKLEGTAFFGALFRQNAQRALLIPRRGFRQRMPLWLSRVRSKRLFDAVSDSADFPIITATWQDCLSSEFELSILRDLLGEISDGRIVIEQKRVEEPTPLARELVFQETNDLMYANDAPEGRARSLLDDGLVRMAAAEMGAEWFIPDDLVALLRARLERTAPGYAPTEWPEMLAHIDERVWIPRAEWQRLKDAVLLELEIESDGHADSSEDADGDTGVRARTDASPPDDFGAQAATRSSRRSTSAHMLQQRLTDALVSRVVWLHASSSTAQPLGELPDTAELGWGVTTAAARPQALAMFAPLVGNHEPTERSLQLFAEWALAPVRLDEALLAETFGIGETGARQFIGHACERGLLQRARFGAEGAPGLLVPENLERLLRLQRTRSRYERISLPLAALPLFLGRRHGLCRDAAEKPGVGDRAEDLQRALERLFAFPGHAEAWERDYLPARCPRYTGADLDALLRESDLLWTGFGNRRVRFMLESDVELLDDPDVIRGSKTSATAAAGKASTEFAESAQVGGTQSSEVSPALAVETRLALGGRYTLGDFMADGLSSEAALKSLWSGVWAGKFSCDDFGVLRRGLEQRFRPTPAGAGRARFDRWKSSRPFGGYWFTLPARQAGDALGALERDRERARILMERYGIVFRELLYGESPAFRGAGIFRALRLMELSGEVTAGHFFDGVSGWQFASPAALLEVANWSETDHVWWLNATDPVACTGPRYADFQNDLPPRLPSTRLLYRGRRLVLVARRNGLELDFSDAPDAWTSGELAPFFLFLLRHAARRGVVIVEKVNGAPAMRGPYEELLLSIGFQRDMNRLVLREYRPLV